MNVSNARGPTKSLERHFSRVAVENVAKEMMTELDIIDENTDLFEREKLLIEMGDDIEGWVQSNHNLDDTKIYTILQNLINKYTEIEKKFLDQRNSLSEVEKAILENRWKVDEEKGMLSQQSTPQHPYTEEGTEEGGYRRRNKRSKKQSKKSKTSRKYKKSNKSRKSMKSKTSRRR